MSLQLQVAVQCDLFIHHMNVKNPYLNAPLDYKICVDPPKGFEGKNGNYVWKLRKSLQFPQNFSLYMMK